MLNGAIIRFAIVCMIGLAPLTAAAQSATQALEDYLAENKCTSTKTEKCLHVLVNYACKSGCPRIGYNWTPDATNPTLRYLVDLHMTTHYLKLLRDAVIEAPGYVLRDNLWFGLTLEELLYHQIQVFLLDKSAQYYSEAMEPRSHTAVQSASYGSHTVDPTRFWMVAFGNDAGAAQAMGQGDFALWLLSVAQSWARVGHADKIDYYLRLSQAVFHSFLVRHDEGGVRNNKRGYRCHPDGTQYCYWFHSGYLSNQIAWPQSVLNKHVNAVRNVLWAHADLAAWRDRPINGVPLPDEFATNGHIEHLRELGRGGLNQLAYGRGHAGDYSAPPALHEFMQNAQMDPHHPSVKRYNSYYRFDMLTHSHANGGTAGNVCHYHYYTLQLFRQILTTISTDPYYSGGLVVVGPDEARRVTYLAPDPDFVALYYKLLYNRSDTDTRTCTNRYYIPPSKKVMRGHPLAEFYYGGKVYTSWPEPNEADGTPWSEDPEEESPTSSFPWGHCPEALWFQLPIWFANHPDAAGTIETRRFFDTAYEGCAF